MENLIKQVKSAVSYHAKSNISKYDILRGDDKLLGLIIDNLNSKQEYDVLHTNVKTIIDDHLSEIVPNDYEAREYELVSNNDIDSQINNAIIKLLNNIDNQFVKSELLRLALAPKKMLRAKMYLKLDESNNLEHAAIIELFHLATLIQDDVIDVANLRRHETTLNSKFNDTIAILVSDYLLVHIGYALGSSIRDNQDEVNETKRKVINYYQELVKDFLKSLLFSEREVTDVRDNKSYDRYASNKTAKFFKVALVSGALANGNKYNLTDLQAIGEFGHDFGLVFQKIDDLLDYQADITISGKDSRDIVNEVNNYILINLKNYEIETIKSMLSLDIKSLEDSEFGHIFKQEIDYMNRRINE